MQERYCISGMILSYSPVLESPLKVVSIHIDRLVLLVPFRGASIYLESL